MKVTSQYAEDHIASLLVVASQGEEIEIALDDKPSLRLLSLDLPKSASGKPARVLGAGRGEMRVPSEDEWRAMQSKAYSHALILVSKDEKIALDNVQLLW